MSEVKEERLLTEDERLAIEINMFTTERVTILVTPAMKVALDKLGQARHTGVSEIVRDLLRKLPEEYEEFNCLYEQALVLHRKTAKKEDRR